MPDDSELPDAGVQLPPPGWYPDPEVVGQMRYWDGGDWEPSLPPLARWVKRTFAALSIAGVIAVTVEYALFNFGNSVPSWTSCNGDPNCRASVCHQLNELAGAAMGWAFIPWLLLVVMAIYGTWLTFSTMRRRSGGIRRSMIVGLVGAWLAVMVMFPPFMALASVNSCLY